jgi:tight adherence protein C
MFSKRLLTVISNRNSQAEERLERIGRPKSLVEIEMSAATEKGGRFKGLQDAFKNLGGVMEPQSDLEKNSLRIKLANAGFRSENAPAVYHGIRVVCLVGCILPVLFLYLLKDGFTFKSIQWTAACAGSGFYLPHIVLWHLRTTRQKEIFLTLPDALDLLVVCVESGLGLGAARRKVEERLSEVQLRVAELAGEMRKRG